MTKMTNKKFKTQARLYKFKEELQKYHLLIQQYNKEFQADGYVDAEEQAFLDKLSITLSKVNSRVQRLEAKLNERGYTDEELQAERGDVTPADQVVFPRDNMNYGVEDNSDPDISTAEGYFADTTVSGTMQASVGVAGANIDTDISLVQEALGLSIIDGDCGPKTIAAIKAFQHKLRVANATTLGEIKQHSQGQLEFSISQGLIEVGDMTYKALFEGQMTLVNTGIVEDNNAIIEEDTNNNVIIEKSDDNNVVAASNLSGSVGQGGNNAADDVRLVQEMLKSNGYNLVPDGDCGNKSIKAIKSYQNKVRVEKRFELAALKPYHKEQLEFRITQGLIEVGDMTYNALFNGQTAVDTSNYATDDTLSNDNDSNVEDNSVDDTYQEDNGSESAGIGYDENDADSFRSQMDNKIMGSATCNVTTLSMQLLSLASNDEYQLKVTASALLRKKGKNMDETSDFEEMLRQLCIAYHKKFAGRTLSKPWQHASVLDGVSELFKDYVSKTDTLMKVFSKKDYFKKVVPSLKKGAEVMLSNNLPGGGHIVHLAGIREDGLVINDPFGCMVDNKQYVHHKVVFSQRQLDLIQNNRAALERRLKTNSAMLQKMLSYTQEQTLEFVDANGLARVPTPFTSGKLNFFDWSEVKKYKIGKWINITHKK